MKKILRIFLLLCAIPTFAQELDVFNHFMVDGIYYSVVEIGSDTATCAVTYHGSTYSLYDNEYTGNVIIPEKVTHFGTTYSVISIAKDAFRDCAGLTSVTIPNSVTHIGSNAFYGCIGLNEINIPNSETDIGLDAFSETGWHNNQPDGILYLDNCCLGYKGEKPSGRLVLNNGTRLIGFGAFFGCSGLTEIIIPNSVKSIGGNVFRECSNLIEVTIGDSVASIGGGAFYGCSGLTSVTIPSSVIRIGDFAFFGCSSVTDIDIPNSVTSIVGNAFDKTGWYNNQLDGILYLDNCCLGYKGEKPSGRLALNNGTRLIAEQSFYDCDGLVSVNIPNTVTSIGAAAFYDCDGLVSVNIPNSVTSIGAGAAAFDDFYGLFSVNIPNSVQGVGRAGTAAFTGCGSLSTIVVDGENKVYDSRDNCNAIIETATNTLIAGCKSSIIPNSVTSIGAFAFSDCRSLTEITIPNSVTSIRKQAFCGCSSLASVSIPSSVTRIGSFAFFYCGNIKELRIEDSSLELDITHFDIAYDNAIETLYLGRNVVSPGASGFRSKRLKDVIIGDSVTSIGFCMFLDCSGLISASIGKSVTSINGSAFNGCSSLTKITIPNSVTSIGNEAFYGCSGLTSVNIGKSVTNIGNYAFKDCSGLAEIVVESGNSVYDSRDNCNAIIKTANNSLTVGCKSTTIPNSVTSIVGHAFDGCSGLTSVTIPNTVKVIHDGAFINCSGLTEIVVESGNSVYDSRDNCNAIIFTRQNSLITGCKTTIIPISVTSIKSEAFNGCIGLSSVTIPNSVTSIGSRAFSGCSAITEITIPNSVTSIGSGAFSETGWYNNQPDGILYLDNCCLGYKGEKPSGRLALNNGTRLIADQSFFACRGLTSITIPNSATSIGNDAFYGCSGLTSVTVPNSITSIGALAFIYCSGLNSLTIGNSVANIGARAFEGCNNLEFIKVLNPIPPICSRTNTTFAHYDSLLEIPEGSLEAYQQANEWCNFTNILVESGVENIEVDDKNVEEVERYDINGRILLQPAHGINIIKMSNGTIRKEAVK